MKNQSDPLSAVRTVSDPCCYPTSDVIDFHNTVENKKLKPYYFDIPPSEAAAIYVNLSLIKYKLLFITGQKPGLLRLLREIAKNNEITQLTDSEEDEFDGLNGRSFRFADLPGNYVIWVDNDPLMSAFDYQGVLLHELSHAVDAIMKDLEMPKGESVGEIRARLLEFTFRTCTGNLNVMTKNVMKKGIRFLR